MGSLFPIFFPGMKEGESKLVFTNFIPSWSICHLVSSDQVNEKKTGNQQFPCFSVHYLYLLPLLIQCCNKSHDTVSFRELKVEYTENVGNGQPI